MQIQKRDNVVDANIVFKSNDDGQTWQDISEGLPEPVIDDYGVGRNDFFADDNLKLLFGKKRFSLTNITVLLLVEVFLNPLTVENPGNNCMLQAGGKW